MKYEGLEGLDQTIFSEQFTKINNQTCSFFTLSLHYTIYALASLLRAKLLRNLSPATCEAYIITSQALKL